MKIDWFRWQANINKEMVYLALLNCCWLCGANIHININLARINIVNIRIDFFFAISIASSVLPLAVGPIRATTRGLLGCMIVFQGFY